MVTNEFPPRIGGIQTHVYELSKALVKLGHQVCVLTRLRDTSLPQAETREGINIFRCKLLDSHLVYNWQLRRKLRGLISTYNIEIVHVHGMRPLVASKNLGVPVIFTNHTSSFIKRSQQGKNIQQKMLKQLEAASIVLAPSQILVEQTRATGYMGPIKFISNGVDIEKFCQVFQGYGKS
jgi:glycosyltransferase involved in cell wall biosynthesis